MHCSLTPPLLLVSLTCVLLGLLFLASLGSVVAFFLFASFVTRSNLSSFVTGVLPYGPSLLCRLLLSVYLVVWVLCPLVFGPIPLLVILLSFLLLFVEGVTIFVSCLLGVPLHLSPLGGLHLLVCICFSSLTPFCCSLLLRGFLCSLLLRLLFSLVIFTCGCRCVPHFLILLYLLSLQLEAGLW